MEGLDLVLLLLAVVAAVTLIAQKIRVPYPILMVVAGLVTYALGTAKEAFDLILSVGAGNGLIYLLRWFWWRVSAWSEMAAMISSFVVALGFFIARKNGVEIATTSALTGTSTPLAN